MMILEDDPYGRLRYSGTPVDAIKTLDRSERVIYTGSFPKSLRQVSEWLICVRRKS